MQGHRLTIDLSLCVLISEQILFGCSTSEQRHDLGKLVGSDSGTEISPFRYSSHALTLKKTILL